MDRNNYTVAQPSGQTERGAQNPDEAAAVLARPMGQTALSAAWNRRTSETPSIGPDAGGTVRSATPLALGGDVGGSLMFCRLPSRGEGCSARWTCWDCGPFGCP
eukprot:6675251-Alexandrium_andersonii.AAC.1